MRLEYVELPMRSEGEARIDLEDGSQWRVFDLHKPKLHRADATLCRLEQLDEVRQLAYDLPGPVTSRLVRAAS